MTGIEQLRAALADDETPAGLDVANVRTRARRTRRRRAGLAVSATAMVAALAVAAPAGLLGGARHTVPAAAPADATLRCPERAPSDRDVRPTLPFAAAQVLVCEYKLGLAAVTLRQDQTAVAALQRSMAAAGRAVDGKPCTLVLDPAVVLHFLATDGDTASVTTQTISCGLVDAAALAKLRKGPSATGCPARPPVLGRGPASTMVADPTRGLLLCRYGGVRPGTAGLLSATALLGNPAEALAHALDALPNTGDAEPSCPFGDTSVVALISAAQPDAPTVANLQCPVVTNGTRRAVLLGTLPDRLAALTG